ncbi:MAG: peptidylprolyl isomerase [Christensenellaceae bacterium]|jgi:peptidyl-prolyl cis-trans isomerase D
MKKLRNLLLLLLVFALLVTGCGKSTDPAKTVLAKVGERTVTLQDFTEVLEYWFYMYQIDPSDDANKEYVSSLAASCFDYLLLTEVSLVKAEELGFFEVSDDEMAAIEEEVNEQYSTAETSVEATIREENPDASDSEIKMKVKLEMASSGYDKEKMIESSIEMQAQEKLVDYCIKDVTISNADVEAEYQNRVEDAKASYEEDPSAFEYDVLYGETPYYTPTGARRVKHILIAFDEDIQSELSSLQSEDEEKYEERLQEELAKIEPDAAALLDKIIKEEVDFDEEMQSSSGDPGLAEFPDGYYVVEENSSFDENFVEAAFALPSIGSISQLVSTRSGYHILRLEEITEAAPLPFADVSEEIEDELLTQTQNETYYSMVSEWKLEADIVTYPKKYETYLKETYGYDISATTSDASAQGSEAP